MKLSKAAEIMYELQERCKHNYWCEGCEAYKGKTCRAKAGRDGVPAGWNITEDDIDRLKREGR